MKEISEFIKSIGNKPFRPEIKNKIHEMLMVSHPEIFNDFTVNDIIFIFLNGLELTKRFCPVCGNEIHVKHIRQGFQKFCSRNCARKVSIRICHQKSLTEYGGIGNASQILKSRSESTNLKRYGNKNASKSDKVKNKIISTNLLVYGVKNVQQNESIRNKTISTNMKLYGGKSPRQSDEINKKAIKTTNELYGGNSPMCSDEVLEKSKKTCLEKYKTSFPLFPVRIDGKVNETFEKFLTYERDKSFSRLFENEEIIPLFSREEWFGGGYDKLYKWKCKICGTEFESFKHGKYHKKCPKCHPKEISSGHESLLEFIKSLTNETILINDRNAIYPKELDIYVPSLKIAFEADGNYFHSKKDKFYHQQKTIDCFNKGIRLFHIIEFEWNKNRSKIEDIISLGISGIEPEDDVFEIDGFFPIFKIENCEITKTTKPVLRKFSRYEIWDSGRFVFKRI